MAGTGLQPANFVLIILPCFLSLTIVAVRVWRKIKEKKFAIEDWLIVIAEAISLALTCTMCKYILVSYSGYHAKDIPKGAVKQSDLLFWRYINNILHNPVLGLVKISFLITLLKLRSCNRLIIASLWTLIAANALFIIIAVLGGIFKCWPVEKSWHTNVPGYCFPRRPYIFGTIGTTIATDFLVALIPAWIIYDLKMSLKNKMAVIAFLSLPLAVTIIGCWRLQTFLAVYDLPKGAGENPHNVRNALTNIEGNLGVIAACGPTLKWILCHFISCLDTSVEPYPYTENSLASRRRRRLRGYRRSYGDVELQTDVVEGSHLQNTTHSSWKSKEDDKASQNQSVHLETRKSSKEITVVELESEVLKTGPVQETKKHEPKVL